MSLCSNYSGRESRVEAFLSSLNMKLPLSSVFHFHLIMTALSIPVFLRVQWNYRKKARVSPMLVMFGLAKKPSLNGAAVAAVIIPRVSPTDAEPFRSLGSMSFWFVSLKARDELRGVFQECSGPQKLEL